jgi:hypothetical protein
VPSKLALGKPPESDESAVPGASNTAPDADMLTTRTAPTSDEDESEFLYATSDCTTGKNGRCERGFLFQCSYDECFVDSDCASKAPCECRESGGSGAANVCLTSGNCRVDADCAPNGYCSPSVLQLCSCPSSELCPDSVACFGIGGTRVPCGGCGDGCGHGHFCHTPSDACLDDSDCCGQGTCNYDTVHRRWDCAECFLQKPENIEPPAVP